MIYHHNQSKERDFKEEYKDAPQELEQANQAYKEAKKKKVVKFFKYIMFGILLFLIYVFLRMGGIQLPQKVDIQEGYEVFLNRNEIDFSLKKRYQKNYIPFIFERSGEYTYYYSSDVDNSFTLEESFPFEIKKYECYQNEQKVSCYDTIDEKGNISDELIKKDLPTNEFTMSIYKGNCDMKDFRIYSGKVLNDLFSYVNKPGAYCMCLELNESKEERIRIELKFKMIQED